MAVVFISPKQKQKNFLLGIIVVFFLFLGVFSSAVFFVPIKRADTGLVFNKPKVDINMSVFDTEKFKILEPIVEIKLQFDYKATTPDGKKIQGSISAASQEEAINALKSKNLKVAEIRELEAGRDNPFIPYFEVKK
jgi:hypothetical protein